MVDGSDAVSVTDCAELYNPVPGVAVTEGRNVSMVYSDISILPELFAVSFAKYFNVTSEPIEIESV